MQTYCRSPLPFIAPLVFGTLTLGGIGIALFAAKPVRYETVIGGVICLAMLACFYWFAVWSISKPAVQIIDNSLEVRGVLGRLYRIRDVNEFELVLSNTRIGFRRKGAQDIMIDKAQFSKRTWFALENHLRQLPFSDLA
jgi:hypothetical protein